jgi:hypothetical protein
VVHSAGGEHLYSSLLSQPVRFVHPRLARRLRRRRDPAQILVTMGRRHAVRHESTVTACCPCVPRRPRRHWRSDDLRPPIRNGSAMSRTGWLSRAAEASRTCPNRRSLHVGRGRRPFRREPLSRRADRRVVLARACQDLPSSSLTRGHAGLRAPCCLRSKDLIVRARAADLTERGNRRVFGCEVSERNHADELPFLHYRQPSNRTVFHHTYRL